MKIHSALFLCMAFAGTVLADEPPRIGIAAPLSGTNSILGRQVAAGARAAAAKSGATPIEADTRCNAEGGKAAAERFAAEKTQVVVGFLCTEALEAALPVLREAGIPTIDVGVRTDRFTAKRAKTDDPVWRIAPRADAEAAAVSRLVAARWRDVPFGILDDGSIYGRGLADAVRALLEADGIRPSNLDTYRPAEEKQFGLVRRMERTGVTHFFIAGERSDAATIMRDAAANGLTIDVIGGEQLLDEPADAAELAVGTLAVGTQGRFPGLAAPDEANAAERQGYFGPSFAAAEIADTAVRLAERRRAPLASVLGETEFQTSLGPVRFDSNGDSNLDLFRVFRFDGRDFAPETGG